jgi:hypothetical protein
VGVKLTVAFPHSLFLFDISDLHNTMNLLTRLRRCLPLQLLLCLTATAIYDDQYGLDDWHVQSVGKIKRAISSEQESTKKISQNFYLLSPSPNNIVASVSARSGELFWRSVEHDNLLDMVKLPNSLLAIGETTYTQYDLLTGRVLSKAEHLPFSSQSVVQKLDSSFLSSKSGVEISIHDPEAGKTTIVSNLKTNLSLLKFKEINAKGGAISFKIDEDTENIEIFSIEGVTVHKTDDESTQEIASIPCENAVFTSDHKIVYSCATGSGVLDLQSLTSAEINSDEIVGSLVANENSVFGHSEESVYKIENDSLIKKPISGKVVKVHVEHDFVYVFYQQKRSIDGLLKIATFDVGHFVQTNLKEIGDFSVKGYGHLPENVIVDEFISKNEKHYRVFFQNGKNLEIVYGNQKWKRHEALAYIDNALVLELPDSSKDDSRLPQGFWNRLEADMFALIDFVSNFVDLVLNHLAEPQEQSFWENFVSFLTGSGEMTKDAFGVHKLIFANSKRSETSYVLDSTDGSVLHSVETPGVKTAEKVIVYSIGHGKQSNEWYKANHDVTMILLDHDNFVQHIYKISSLNGDLIRTEIESKLRVKNVLADAIIFEDDSVTKLSDSVAEKLFFTRNTETSITGLVIENEVSETLWKWETMPGEKIIDFTRQDMSVKTNAIGRALNDRSIQYKYLNPHIAVVLTESKNAENQAVLGVYALDTVTGSVVHTQSHIQAAAPVKSAIIDNWISYTYWDVKRRRFHIESLEFYKGKASTFNEMKNFVVDTFSSSESTDSSHEIKIIRQGYLVPFEPASLVPTKTKKGITQRSIILSSKNSGMIVSIPYRMLDARRIPKTFKYDVNGKPTLAFDPAKVDDSYELPGAYYPEMVINPETLITHNRTVIGINKIIVSPVDLESTDSW